MKYAIIFPGQGSQSLGMLSALADNFPIVKQTFDEAAEALGFDLWQITQHNQTALNQTKNTQPAMLAAGFATYQVLSSEADLSPVAMAGHSLGEWTALVAAGALRFSDGIRLVKKRAELMQDAVPAGTGAMAAILGLDDEIVVKVCAEYSGAGVVEAVNFNAAKQVVIAGNKNAVEATCDLMQAAGAKRTIILPVSVPSHCSLMKTAAEQFASAVNATEFNTTDITILHNVDAQKADNPSALKSKLIMQLQKPVLWSKTVRLLSDLGAAMLIESGPGLVLTGLTKRIDKSLTAFAAADVDNINKIINEVKK